MKDIKGYEGLYAITSCGKVWSYRNNRFLKPKEKRWGYQGMVLFKNHKGKNHLIHRLVAQAYIPNPENLSQVNHKDRNKANNALPNLEWVSPRENRMHYLLNR